MGNSETVMSGSTLDDWMHIDDTPGAREEFGNPESWDWIVKNGDTDTSAMAAQKGGDLTEMSNFLATDDVPETLFGFPVVTKDYTPEDLAFFKAHPEAGGYYDMSDEGGEPEAVSGALFAGDTRGKYPGAWNNPGNVRPGAVNYHGQTGTVLSKKGSGRFLTFDTPQSGLNSMSNVIGQIVRVKITSAGESTLRGELVAE